MERQEDPGDVSETAAPAQPNSNECWRVNSQSMNYPRQMTGKRRGLFVECLSDDWQRQEIYWAEQVPPVCQAACRHARSLRQG